MSNVTGTEQILLDALHSIAAVEQWHTDRVILNMAEEANNAIKKFHEEKERIANIPPY